MMREAECKDGKISIDLWDALSTLKDEQRQELVEALACQESIIDYVAEQILGGYTPNISRGSGWINARPKPLTALERARRRIAEQSSAMAAKEIADLKERWAEEHKRANETYEKLNNLENRMRHHEH